MDKTRSEILAFGFVVAVLAYTAGVWSGNGTERRLQELEEVHAEMMGERNGCAEDLAQLQMVLEDITDCIEFEIMSPSDCLLFRVR